jgi:hypothetical protein
MCNLCIHGSDRVVCQSILADGSLIDVVVHPKCALCTMCGINKTVYNSDMMFIQPIPTFNVIDRPEIRCKRCLVCQICGISGSSKLKGACTLPFSNGRHIWAHHKCKKRAERSLYSKDGLDQMDYAQERRVTKRIWQIMRGYWFDPDVPWPICDQPHTHNNHHYPLRQ